MIGFHCNCRFGSENAQAESVKEEFRNLKKALQDLQTKIEMHKVLQAPRGSFWDKRMMWELYVNYWYLGGIIGRELQGALGQERCSFSRPVTITGSQTTGVQCTTIWIAIHLVLKTWHTGPAVWPLPGPVTSGAEIAHCKWWSWDVWWWASKRAGESFSDGWSLCLNCFLGSTLQPLGARNRKQSSLLLVILLLL